MIQFIEQVIQHFLKMDKVTIKDLKATDYQDFFISELYDDISGQEIKLPIEEETMDKEYIITKLYCGKENAKSCIL